MKKLLIQTFFTILSISCMAQISGSIEIPTVGSPSDILVAKVNLSKGDASGVGKLELQIPSGLQFIEAVSNAGATVRHSAGVVKFLWIDLPAKKELEATFKFKAATGKSGTQTITSTFSYRNGDETQVERLPAATIDIAAAEVEETAAEPKKAEPTKTAESTATMKTKSDEAKPAKSESKTSAKAVAKKEESIKNEEIDKDYNKALFHVQLASSKNALSEDGIKKRFSTSREILVIKYDDGYKYAVGRLKNYEAAKALCAEIKDSGEFSSCFVTSSYQGNYIPLQEAMKMNR